MQEQALALQKKTLLVLARSPDLARLKFPSGQGTRRAHCKVKVKKVAKVKKTIKKSRKLKKKKK